MIFFSLFVRVVRRRFVRGVRRCYCVCVVCVFFCVFVVLFVWFLYCGLYDCVFDFELCVFVGVGVDGEFVLDVLIFVCLLFVCV